MHHIELDIENSGGQKLHALLELPDGAAPSQFAIFAHCFTCSSDFVAVRTISKELTNHGFGVVRFDFTGLGQSEGHFKESTFSANIDDIIAVNNYLSEHYQSPTLLLGHSLGGAAVVIAASKITTIKAVATIGAPAEASHIRHLFKDDIDNISSKKSTEVDIGGRSFQITQQFLDDLDTHDVLAIVNKLKKPLLIMHSPQDKVVAIYNAAKIYKAAFHPKSFISLDGADHLLSDREDSAYVADVVGAWVARYLKKPLKKKKRPLNPNQDQVVAHLDLIDNFQTSIANGSHSLTADEPKSMGGDDTGFAPYDLLNAALGACTVMTLKLYAERKKWDLKEAYVYLTFSRKSGSELNIDGGDTKKIHHIIKSIELIGDLSREQRQRLIEIAAKCPVHRTIVEGVVVDTVDITENSG